jgi:phosphocarrier protein
MIKTSVTISNKLGLHARASAKLTKLAGSYPCEVWMSRGERRVNAKSIMGVMMLAAGLGSTVELETDGPREQEAMDALVALIHDKIGEGQRAFPSTDWRSRAASLSAVRCWWPPAVPMWRTTSSSPSRPSRRCSASGWRATR